MGSPISHYCLTIASLQNSTVKEIGVASGLCIPRECSGAHIDELLRRFLADTGTQGVQTSTACGSEHEQGTTTGFIVLAAL